MLDDLLDLPISRLWDEAQKNHLTIGISVEIDKGRACLDSLNVWDGPPGHIGSTCICKASLVDLTIDEAASLLLEDMDGAFSD